MDYNNIVEMIKTVYHHKEFIPLHEPVFIGNEKKYLNECIDSTFVSSVGKYVDQFEEMVAEYAGAKYAIATVNGTAALHIALRLAGVMENSEVITQPLTFVATVNAIRYCSAKPVFIDVDKESLGLCPDKLEEFFKNETAMDKNGNCVNKKSKNVIKACVPMHTFGFPCRVDKIVDICKKHNVEIVEDSAESLGSFYNTRHTGTFGKLGIFSFNGNKTITTGGGGMIITDDKDIARRAKHITTTAKKPHKYEYVHDEIGYNYRLPNLNAALGVAGMENLEKILNNKREIHNIYKNFFKDEKIQLLCDPAGANSNYWLNALVFENETQRDEFLEITNSNGVMTRPVWCLMNRLEMFKDSQTGDLSNAEYFEKRVVNIPSGAVFER